MVMWFINNILLNNKIYKKIVLFNYNNLLKEDELLFLIDDKLTAICDAIHAFL